jgi:hypothetical protein
MPIDFSIRDFCYPLSIYRLRRTFERTQWLSPGELAAYQNQRLAGIIRHACDHVPYYRRLFNNLGLSSRDIQTVDDLKKLPILSKSAVRESAADFVADNASRYRPRAFTTSGTTGSPLQFYLDKNARILEFVYYWRHWSWAGYRLGDLFAQLSRNLESACIKARRYRLAPVKIAVLLKEQNFHTEGAEARLSRPSARPLELSGIFRGLFDSLYRRSASYRATGVVLLDLIEDNNIQYPLFESPLRIERIEQLYGATDLLAERYGKHTLHLGGSHMIEEFGKGKRGAPTEREKTRFRGESKRKHLGLPIIHVKV